MFRWKQGTAVTRDSEIYIDRCRLKCDPADLFDAANSTGVSRVHVTNCIGSGEVACTDYHAEITGGGSALLLDSATTTRIEDAADPVNTYGKFVGRSVYNTTTNKTVFAGGTGTTDHWYTSDGTDTHTPS